ncbi:MAG: DEAD/DEAH box helicase [Phycisphaerales bacterium]
MQFTNLGLSPAILRALEQEGYVTPTPIQHQTIPHVLAGRDVLGCARTGTGKTAAFALPILHRLASAAVDKSKRGPRKARALILSPTRELAAQIADSFAAYGRELHLESTVVFGGVSQFHQERALRRGVDIIVATPGRLLDLMEQRIADLSGVEVLVLDEADRMLDMGFIQPIRRIASATPAKTRQTLLFSATMPNSVAHLAASLLRDPIKIAVDPVSSAVPKIAQSVYMVPRNAKQSLLEHLLAGGGIKETAKTDKAADGKDAAPVPVTRALVFTRTKHGAEKVGRKLAHAGISADTIHGNKSQPQRKRALARFTSGAATVLVATDVAARGLDVDDISHVFNFDLPVEPEAYVHRIGRTGRAGACGIALSFCDSEERSALRDIERLLGTRIEVKVTPAITIRPEPAHAHPQFQPQSEGHSSGSSRSYPRSYGERRASGHQGGRSNAHANGHSGGSSSGHSHGHRSASAGPRANGPAAPRTNGSGHGHHPRTSDRAHANQPAHTSAGPRASRSGSPVGAWNKPTRRRAAH